MKKSIGGLVVCLFGLVACNVEHYDDCDGDGFDDGDAFGGSHSRAGASSTAGKAGSTSANAGTAAGGTEATSGGAGSAGTAAATAGGEAGVTPPDACDRERDCGAGYNCDVERRECLPADEETCGELETEAACSHRSDCTPIYGGTNCSCGQDCECKGGEPGCVCDFFQFFACEATPQ